MSGQVEDTRRKKKKKRNNSVDDVSQQCEEINMTSGSSIVSLENKCKKLEKQVKCLRANVKRQIYAYERLIIGNSIPILNIVISNLRQILTEDEQDKSTATQTDKMANERKILKKRKKSSKSDGEDDHQKSKKKQKKRKIEAVATTTDPNESSLSPRQEELVTESPSSSGDVELVEDIEVVEIDPPPKVDKLLGTITLVSPSKPPSQRNCSRSSSPELVQLFVPGTRNEDQVRIKTEKRQQHDPSDISQSASTSHSSQAELILDNPPIIIRPKRKITKKNQYHRKLTSGKNKEGRKILKLVTRWLALEDLKSCRLVNTRWYEIFSAETLKRDICAVKLKYHSRVRCYVMDRSATTNVTNTVINLCNCLDKAKMFPCSDFSFEGEHLGLPELQKFFVLHGHCVKTLRILRQKPKTSLNHRKNLQEYAEADFVRKLLEQTPHAENLHIGIFSYNFHHDIKLPSLRTLSCESGKDYNKYEQPKSSAFEMLSTAPNLETVYNFKADYIDWFLENNKLHTIKSYDFEIYVVNEEKLLTFANAQPELEILKISVQDLDVTCHPEPNPETMRCHSVQVLNLLLASSKNSLKKLEITALCVLDPGLDKIKIPQLTSLKELTFVGEKLKVGFERKRQDFLPNIFKMAQVFPNLTTFNLFLSMDMDHTWPWDEYLPIDSDHMLTKVKTLGLYGSLSRVWSSNLKAMCPSVTKIVMYSEPNKGIIYLRMVVKRIATYFENLEELEFFGCGWWFRRKRQTLDTALTGFSKLQVKLAHESNGDRPTRTQVSILDLKKLKKLKILISNETWSPRSILNFDLITDISRRYGLQLMPQLRVVIAYHQYCSSSTALKASLASLATHKSVTLVHEKYQNPFPDP